MQHLQFARNKWKMLQNSPILSRVLSGLMHVSHVLNFSSSAENKPVYLVKAYQKCIVEKVSFILSSTFLLFQHLICFSYSVTY